MLLRAAIFVGLVLALWTASRSAFAMPAGLCDDRGASVIAPAPALEAPDMAIGRARFPASCEGRGLPEQATLTPAHRVLAFAAGEAEPALTVAPVWLHAAAGEQVPLVLCAERPCRGIRWRVERPPRG